MRLVLGVVLGLTLVSAQVRKDRHVIVVSLDGFPAYALQDPALAFPNIRKLAGNGAMAGRMEPVNPAVTWPNHTSMVTGVRPARHGVIYNGLPVRGEDGFSVRIDPWAEKAKLVQAPTVYDAAHAAGLTTAEIDWVAITRPGTITWSFGEVPEAAATCVKEMVAAGLVTDGDIREFTKRNIVFRDEMWTRAAEHTIETHKPNLLLFHLLATDSSQHTYGARGLAAWAALALADARLGRLMAAVERAGIAENTTFFVVSDHGFKSYSRTIRGLDLLDSKELQNDVFILPEGGTAMVYVRPSRRGELVPKLRAAFTGKEGIASVIGPEDYARLGYPDPAKSDRMADLVLAASPSWSFGRVSATQNGGAHGYLTSEPDMNAILVVSGAGVRKGSRIDHTANLNVAPTIARLLGIELGQIEGIALSAFLQ